MCLTSLSRILRSFVRLTAERTPEPDKHCFMYGILRNGIVCYIRVPQRSGYYHVIRMIAFGVG